MRHTQWILFSISIVLLLFENAFAQDSLDGPIQNTPYIMNPILESSGSIEGYGNFVFFGATEKIILKPGFKAGDGAKFAARIGDFSGLEPETDSDSDDIVDWMEYVVVGDLSLDSLPDETAPIITVLGQNPTKHKLGDTYVDSGAEAIDDLEGNISSSIQVESTVDINQAGEYQVTYSVMDSAGNNAISKQRVVIVMEGQCYDDTTKPEISIIGQTPLPHLLGAVYEDPGATATDYCDGDITDQITVTGTVDVNQAGEYVQTYNVLDSSGNAADPVQRTVKVIEAQCYNDVTKPEIALIGDSLLNHRQGDSFEDPGATATDYCEGDLTQQINVTGTIDISLPGEYILTYNVSDSAGNAADPIQRTVKVIENQCYIDITKPTITMVGNSVLVHQQGEAFQDPGATATDYCEGDLTEQITITGTINISLPGEYVLTYNVSDSAGNAADPVQRTIIVKEPQCYTDTTKPEITILGSNPIIHQQGDVYADPGATATDYCEGDLTEQIIVTGSIDINQPGEYVLTYTVSDSSDNAADPVQRTIIVKEPQCYNDVTKPEITILGENPITHQLGIKYEDPGATSTDYCDGALTDQILVTGAVNINEIGDYVLTYSVSDSSGNQTTVERTVTVQDNVTCDEMIQIDTTYEYDAGGRLKRIQRAVY